MTVDVTGVWVGSLTGQGFYEPTEVQLDLQQQGQKVTGYFRSLGGNMPSGPVEGTVAGDVFTFKTTNGVLAGETTVNGDEMRITLAGTYRMQALLRRTNSSTPARSQ